MTPESLQLLQRIAGRAVYFMAFGDAEWKRVVELGRAGLLRWPKGESLVSV